jgi:hypothetical protein
VWPPRGHLADRFFERQDAPLSHVARDQPREIAVTARVRQPEIVLFAGLERRAGVSARDKEVFS